MKVKIYTKSGDTGETSLYGGKRVSKCDLQVSAYGTIDELNCHIGLLISHISNQNKLKDFLLEIQSDLMIVGSHLSGGKTETTIIGKRIIDMEKLIDGLDKELPVLTNFILPGGTIEASFAQLARSVVRRAERKTVKLKKERDFVDPLVIKYLNRLSDLLFVIARYLNNNKGIAENIWKT